MLRLHDELAGLTFGEIKSFAARTVWEGDLSAGLGKSAKVPVVATDLLQAAIESADDPIVAVRELIEQAYKVRFGWVSLQSLIGRIA